MFEDLEYVQSLEKEVDELESKKAEFSNEYDLLLQECLSHDIMNAILCSFDDIDEQTKILKSRTSNVKAVCVTCGKCVFNSNHDACVSKFINDVNARTKKPKVVPISARKPKRQTNQSIATPHRKTFASESTIQKSRSYFRMLYENTSKTWTWWVEKQCPSDRTNHPIHRELVQGNVTIKRVYYIEGLNHNLFLVGQFCDANLEVAFRKSTCFVKDL
ncbi:hypothetical protein Tco_1035892 [Tanacetum coccineum]